MEDQKKYVDKLIFPQEFDTFNLKVLEDLALNYVNEVDYIICTSDINTDRFPKSKIIGNTNTHHIKNKWEMYKKLHKNFLMPLTFKLNDINEAKEIIKNYENKKFIIKPISSTGGIGIKYFEESQPLNKNYILQEYIEGKSVSSSFLSYKTHDITMVTTSDQIIGSKILGGKEFLYCGNITPLINSSPKLVNISTKISKMYKLLGSNGVDFILHNNNVYVLEVNPRIQGTFECIEHSFDMNLAKAHIDSCNNNIVQIPKLKNFCIKLVPYSFKDAKYNLKGINNLFDISPSNYLYKKGMPISSIIVSDRILENAMGKAEIIRKKVYNSII